MKFLTVFFLSLASTSVAQKATVVKFDSIEKLINEKSEKIMVINFWATWCAPCVKELPLFEKLNASNPSVAVILINLDFADKLDKVNSFLIRKDIKSRVLLLDEIDYNRWIDKIDKNWSGAIPATMVINSSTGKKRFVEKELLDNDLEKLIHEVL